MTRTLSRIRPVALLLAAALLTFSCKRSDDGAATTAPQAGGEQPAPIITVGFSQIGAESAWRTAETASIRSEAEARGIDLQFSDAQQKQENQIKALNGFIAQGVDAIILAPVVKTGWEPVLRSVRDAGIPVILVDRGVDVSDDSLYTTLIASDFVEEGRMAGQWLADKTGGNAKIVELKGTTGSDPAIEREKGFHEIIDQHPDMTVIKSQTGEFTRAKGKEVMEAFLKAEGDKITAVYAHNDDMALGAIQAIEEAGKKPGEDIIVVSIDGVRGAFEAMVAGKLNCTVECNPLLGPMAFDAVEAVLADETLPKHRVVVDRVFDQSTAAAEIENRQY